MSYKLLEETRLGILTSMRANGTPIAVPIWFDWDGSKIQFFAGADSKKVKRIEREPNISLLVTNNVGEAEAWISFDGIATIHSTGGIELAERLANRYWNMNQQSNVEKLKEWMAYPDAFVRYEMTPSKIREGQ